MEWNFVAGQGRRRRLPKMMLLLVELLAVAGLLMAAVHLWQVRQALYEDLKVAQEVEAVMQKVEGKPDASEQAVGEGDSVMEAGSATGAPWLAPATPVESNRLPALWLSVGVENDS